ncbi:BrnT family toxin [Kumtagia ephedrae]|uniref:BrnT family toxin n=1 Tax=Kumtagia ephedrae TaxID=2116701 RepID=A0A2P7SDG1_9HYPH|nr:BrnT family toxin [Mesorhizobium ephedrae]PSJ60507.1 BrnT family toxin [Mesorhizobium ephedrae]
MHRVEKLEFEAFDWDEEKRQRILREREIDFLEAAQALLLPHLEGPSDKQGEARTLAVCLLHTKIVAVVYTERGDVCRIITARAARRYERKEYREVFGG